jgi:hypothetical protein
VLRGCCSQAACCLLLWGAGAALLHLWCHSCSQHRLLPSLCIRSTSGCQRSPCVHSYQRARLVGFEPAGTGAVDDRQRATHVGFKGGGIRWRW